MDRAFMEIHENLSWNNGGGDSSGEDDESFPDRVVYHDEEHLANLFRLYNRPKEDKNLDVSDVHTNKTVSGYSDMGHQSDCVLAVRPSMQEIAVWNALQEELGDVRYDCVRRKDNIGSRITQDLDDLLGREGAMNAFPVNQSMGPVNEANGVQKLKDVWDMNGDPHDMEHIISLPSAKIEFNQMEKQRKEIHKKRTSFSFRAVKNIQLQSSIREMSDKKPSLMDQLINLETADKPWNAAGNMQNALKNSTPSVNMPISKRLFELVQQDAQSKAQEIRDANSKSKRSTLEINRITECITGRGDTITQQDGKVHGLIKSHNSSNEGIHQKLQKALLEAPPLCMERINSQGKGQGSVFEFTGRLQKVLERQRNDRTAFLRMLQSNDIIGYKNCMELKIINKSLEACFASCLCEVLNLPEGSTEDGLQTTLELTVIFNLQTNADLELEVGNIVRIYPPW